MKYDEVTRQARRKEAWEMRYEKKLTWTEIGAALGVTRQRAMQLAAEHRRREKEKEGTSGSAA